MKDPKILSYLNSLEVSTKLSKLLDKHKVEEKKIDLVKEVISSYLEGDLREEEIADELNERAKIDFNQALDLADDLIEQFISSLAPDVTEKIRAKTFGAQEITADLLIEEIKKEANLKIEKKLGKRFENIIFNWFRNVRDDNETLDTLIRSVKIGGLGLDFNQGQNVLAILKKKQTVYESRGIMILDLINQQLQKEIPLESSLKEEEIDVAAKPIAVTVPKEKITSQETTIEELLKTKGVAFEELTKKEEIKKQLVKEKKEVVSPLLQEIEEKEKFLESKPEIKSPLTNAQPMTQASQEIVAKEEFFSPKTSLSEPKIMPPATYKQQIIKKTEVEGLRPRVEDVKIFTEPQLIGPIDELAALKIEDFRRLSKDAKEAAKKILAKLELLEDESLEKREAGIKALKSSPLYKAYAEVMTNCLKQGKNFEQIIQENPIMTIEEFKAIMSLNKNLKV